MRMKKSLIIDSTPTEKGTDTNENKPKKPWEPPLLKSLETEMTHGGPRSWFSEIVDYHS